MPERMPGLVPLGVAAALLLGACTAPIPAADAGGPPFPECEADAYAFIGETSLAAIGLAEMWPEEAGRVGEIWVTAVPPEQFGPPGAPPMGQRVICLEFDDGSGMAGPIDDAWEPTGGALTLLPEAGGELPWAGLAAVVAVILVLVISLLAFRTRPREPGEPT